jgi:hypothetical protein
MTRRAQITFDSLPMFADDEKIGEAVLGYDNRRKFHAFAELLESEGMPTVDKFWGGRCVPAVRAFLLAEYGLAAETPLAPNGTEGKWDNQPKQAGRRVRA